MSVKSVTVQGLFSASLLVGGASVADAGLEPLSKVSAERFRPAFDGSGILGTEWAEVRPHLGWELGLLLGHANDPLLAVSPGSEVATDLVGARTGASLWASVAFLRLLELGVEVPLVLHQSGDTLEEGRSLSGGGVGSIRFGSKLGILTEREHGLAVSMMPTFLLPAGKSREALGEDGVAFSPEILISKRVEGLRLAGSLGYSLRGDVQADGHHYGSDLHGTLAAGLSMAELGGFESLPLELGLSLTAVSGLPVPFTDRRETGLELLAGVSHAVTDRLGAFAAMGVGLTDGFGTPDWRGLLGVRLWSEGSIPDGYVASAPNGSAPDLYAQDDQEEEFESEVESTPASTPSAPAGSTPAPKEPPKKPRNAPRAITLTPFAGPAAQVLGVDVRGFIQGSFQLLPVDFSTEFRLDEAELSLAKRLEGKASGRFDLNFRQADFPSAGSFDLSRIIEQAWVSIDVAEKATGLRLLAGRIELPIGAGSLDGPERLDFSRTYTEEIGRPRFGTGAMIVNERKSLDLALFAINGWESMGDQNAGKTFGMRLGVLLFDKALRLGAVYALGEEQVPVRTPVTEGLRQLANADVTLDVKWLRLQAELDYIRQEKGSLIVPGRKAEWLSFVGSLGYEATDWLWLTVRFEHADDGDASRFHLVGSPLIGTMGRSSVISLPLTVESLAAALAFQISEEARFMVEWRSDFTARDSNPPAVFPLSDGTLESSRHVLSLSSTFAW